MIQIALFEPDIPQNTGTILRLANCFNLIVNIIEPCGFIFGGAKMKRAGMDYIQDTNYVLHSNFNNFLQAMQNNPIVLCTTKSNTYYHNYKFLPNTCLLFGSESKGVTNQVRSTILQTVKIPMQAQARSLNLAVSCGIIVAEALRQNNFFTTIN